MTKLYPKNSIEDLILRGYKRDEIKKLTSIDPGYHNMNYRQILKNTNKIKYQLEFIKTYHTQSLSSILSLYAQGLTKTEVLNLLEIHDMQLKLKTIFENFNMLSEFNTANNTNRKNYLNNGMLNKYGVDNPFKLNEFQEKAKNTRTLKYGGEYTLSKSSSLAQSARLKINETIKDPSVITKREETNLHKYGVRYMIQNPDIKEKIRRGLLKYRLKQKHNKKQTSRTPNTKSTIKYKHALKRFNLTHTSQLDYVKNKYKNTSLTRYGVDHPSKLKNNRLKAQNTNSQRFGYPHASQSPKIKEKIIQSNLQRYGVSHFSQTDTRRIQQSQYMHENYDKHFKKRQEKGNSNISQPEIHAINLLQTKFPNVITQYKSSNYPYYCDAYIPNLDLYIEFNYTWTHGNHWFDKNDKSDIAVADKWSTSNSKYYQNAFNTWTIRDVTKRNTARDNNLNYLVLWYSDLSDLKLWLALNCPTPQDWKQEYSWLPKRYIDPMSLTNPKTKLKLTAKTITKVAKESTGYEFYKNELDLWNNHRLIRNKLIQPFIYINRFKYLNKLPHQLSDLEILRAFKISGVVQGYSSFNAEPMIEFIKQYDIKSICDPCAGWGERLLAAIALDINYQGVDINNNLKIGHNNIIKKYALNLKSKYNVAYDDSQNITFNAEAMIVCPPYHNLEHYTNYGAENLNYTQFLSWWNKIIQNANTKYIGLQINQKLKHDLITIICQHGYSLISDKHVLTQKNHFTKNTKNEHESFIILKKD